MSRLDEAIASVAYILDCLMAYRNMIEAGDCNSCKNKDCQWKPKLGQLVRCNCPHYKAEEESIIDRVPPADVATERHGKWKKIGEWGRVYRCNQCGNFLDFDGVNAGRGDANFCPHCGAKMDGKREE